MDAFIKTIVSTFTFFISLVLGISCIVCFVSIFCFKINTTDVLTSAVIFFHEAAEAATVYFSTYVIMQDTVVQKIVEHLFK